MLVVPLKPPRSTSIYILEYILYILGFSFTCICRWFHRNHLDLQVYFFVSFGGFNLLCNLEVSAITVCQRFHLFIDYSGSGIFVYPSGSNIVYAKINSILYILEVPIIYSSGYCFCKAWSLLFFCIFWWF